MIISCYFAAKVVRKDSERYSAKDSCGANLEPFDLILCPISFQILGLSQHPGRIKAKVRVREPVVL
jgi:hypothetical protein